MKHYNINEESYKYYVAYTGEAEFNDDFVILEESELDKANGADVEYIGTFETYADAYEAFTNQNY